MLCQEFAVRNGGELMIESEAGKGSVFTVKLPAGE
jgi:signal transduction histidine kinase